MRGRTPQGDRAIAWNALEIKLSVRLLGAPRAARSKGLSSSVEEKELPTGQSIPGTMRSAIARGQRRLDKTEARWSRDHEHCIDCGTKERPHRAFGRCKRCDDRWRYRAQHEQAEA
jgi:hypothetical protein